MADPNIINQAGEVLPPRGGEDSSKKLDAHAQMRAKMEAVREQRQLPEVRGEVRPLKVPSKFQEQPCEVNATIDLPEKTPLYVVDGTGQVKMFSFFEELSEPVKKLIQKAWESRGKLLRDVKAYVVTTTCTIYSMPGRAHKVISNPKLHALLAEEEDPQALAAVVCGSGGALCLGSVGAAVGATSGAAIGTAIGAVPALLTLGLSLPIGAFIGGAGGLFMGAGVGSTTGFVGGAVCGTTVASFRNEIRATGIYAGSKLYDGYDLVILRPLGAVRATSRKVRDGVSSGTDFTKAKAAAAAEILKEAAADRRCQVTALGAGVGATALGTAGAAGGALAGGTTGALIGVIPAIVTFGLSIPIGAVIGGSAGLLVGGAAGTSLGFAGGGTASFLAYSMKDVPSTLRNFAAEKATLLAGAVRRAPADTPGPVIEEVGTQGEA